MSQPYNLDCNNYRFWLNMIVLHLHTIRDEKDMFAGLGWEKEIRSLGDHHIPFNPSPEFEFVAGNRGSDDYKLTSFS